MTDIQTSKHILTQFKSGWSEILDSDWCNFMMPTYEQQVILHEVDPVSLSQRSVELDAGAGCDNALLVFFGLAAVGTLKHWEAAATGLHTHTDTHTKTGFRERS